MASIKTITTPDFGSAENVTVIEILVKPGDALEADTAIATLESDKATMELPATEAGVVKEIKVKVGDKLQTGSPILTLETGGAAEKPETKAPKTEEPPKAEPPKKIAEEALKEPGSRAFARDGALRGLSEEPAAEPKAAEEAHAGPGVRRRARELGINLAQVQGSGPKQRIVKEDLETFTKSQQQAPSPSMGLPALPTIDFSKYGPTETIELSRIKKISGKNLQRNWMMIPHITQFGEADITELEQFRQAEKVKLEKQKIKLTPLVFIMKAVVSSLKVFPQFNASLDASNEHLVIKKYFHIGVAVDTPDGLVVPVIRDVDKKGLVDLAKELAQTSEKARNKQLTPMDMQGGCISISSLGGIGGTAFTPIINYPEVAILGVSKTAYKPVYQEGEFKSRLMLPLSLSYDHRVIDGADGARFIAHLTDVLSDIRNLLM